MIRPAIALLTALAVFVPLSIAQADVTLPNVIGSNMVLQRDIPLNIWGWATPGEKVTVTLGDAKVDATANDAGEWKAKLPPQKSGGAPLEMTVAGKNTIKLTNILIGEVWVGSGQSNMEWSVSNSNNPKEEIAGANFPKIRLFLVSLVPSGEPARDVNASWKECSPATVPSFSAVLYFFGRDIHKELDVPVGLIATSWGGTRIEPWIPPAGFASEKDLKGEGENVAKVQAAYQQAVKTQLPAFKAWLESAEKSATAGQPIAPPPSLPKHPLNSNGQPTGLYNGMVHPIAPFGIRGALWYQGESNLGQGMKYYTLMRGLVQGWREVWGQGEFPFLFTQLAPYKYGAKETALPEIWEAQTASLQIPNTGMAVLTDITNLTDIHPRNKQDVGKRLARWALNKTYGKTDVVVSGPLYDSKVVEEGRIKIKFKHAEGMKARDDKPLTWFAIAGDDKLFVQAEATIEGDTIVVQSPKVPKPLAVRFGWHQLAEPNLVNKAGLPASPFRTDDWTDAASAPLPGK